MGELGELLKTSREQLGRTLEDVEGLTRISVRYLQALEDESFDVLPHRVVTMGFLRNYAKAVSLDPDHVVELYRGPAADGRRRSHGDAGGPIQFKDIPMARPSGWTADAAVGILALLVLVAMVAGGIYVYGDRATQWAADLLATPAVPTVDVAFILPTPTPAPTFTATPTATATPQYYTGVALELVVSADSWVQVLVDGAKTYEGILKSGERRQFSAERQVAVRAGNAGGVEAFINGESAGTLGEPGQVVDRLWEMLPEGTVVTPTPIVLVTEENPQ